MRSVQRNPETDRIYLITVAGVDNGEGSRIVFRDSRSQRPLVSGASNLNPRHDEDDITRGCTPLPIDGSIPMFFAAIRDQGFPSNETNECQNQGTVAEQPLRTPAESDHIVEETDHTIRSERSMGEYPDIHP